MIDKPASHPACTTFSPEYEQQRLAALARYQILDTAPEPGFDQLVQLAAYICQAPIAVINFIDRERQWFKAEVGLGVRETPLDVSICAQAILQKDLFVVPDTRADTRFAENPLVTGAPYLRFYAGALLSTEDGYPLGTLCVLDHQPRQLSPEQEQALSTLAQQVMTQLELVRINRTQAEMLVALDQARADLAKLASTDSLTGLLNRRAFDERMNQELARLQRQGTTSCLMMVDLDYFKRINDQYGHLVGDEVLVGFAELCRGLLRTSDVIGRWGGEEFIILLPDIALEQAQVVASRLQGLLAQTAVSQSNPTLRVTLSIGIIPLRPGLDIDHALQVLDEALYNAKAQGRNTTVLGTAL